MSVVPDKALERLQFYEDHIAPFTANATQIGLVAGDVTDLQTKCTAARTAYNAAQAARQSSKVATESWHNAIQAVTETGAALLKKIRGEAEQTGNPAVYTMAAIPAPAIPTPKGAPGEPKEFKVELQANGALTITWKCENPAGSQGTSYMVWRRIAGTAELKFLGATGLKEFVDATIPPGTVSATYQVQGFRSTMAGPWAQYNVNFTTELGTGVLTGAMGAAVPKIAA